MPRDDMTGKIAAIIPARGGSKRVPGKNLRVVSGHPLLAHTVLHALRSDTIDTVCVSTDSDEVAEVAKSYGARVVRRPDEISSDTSTSESAVLHALDVIEKEDSTSYDAVVMLQCTSPVRCSGDIDNAVRQFRSNEADSLLSACPAKHFLWRNSDGVGTPINYDYENRPRSQDVESQYQENGSIYITKIALLRAKQCRLGGRISVYKMDFWSSFELDNEDDFALVDWIMRNKLGGADSNPELTKNPELIVFDFDGVMTNNTAVLDQDGREHVRVHRGDGLGIDMLREAGQRMLVLSSEKNKVVRQRCDKLGIECINGVRPKVGTLEAYHAKNGIDPAKTIYVGNDLNDLDCFEYVGCAVAVSDAHPKVIQAADIVLSRKGGEGAVRELCELVMEGDQVE